MELERLVQGPCSLNQLRLIRYLTFCKVPTHNTCVIMGVPFEALLPYGVMLVMFGVTVRFFLDLRRNHGLTLRRVLACLV